ncbi:DUF262 domain-containing protein [Paracoccus yeei]|uniref:DUF262 domain-containing protein n=1 Tax=Paracoccus yeei TaxID=147645 RepID=A0A1V0GT32_9RHOB|nr:DUF262 domain-containing protein [Paracoccus yeei]ARC36849.1 DUF262 domain-containing protein [Paracoccus yeei]
MADAVSSITTPQIIPLYDLIDRVASGELKIPKFQRPYVWSPDDMLALFDSIFQGYPIGSLLIWETDRPDISSLKEIGPLELKDTAHTGATSYVVDGHQRLATLVGVLALPEDYPSETLDQWRWWIGFDLNEKEFTHYKRKNSKPEKDSIIVPLRRVIKTTDFARFTRDLASQVSEDKLDYYLEGADYLNRKLREYKVPATVMKSGSLDDAVNIFSRVNQRGRDMTPDQMVSALTFRDKGEGEFDLSERIDQILSGLTDFGFGSIERKSVLQSILFAAKINFTRPSFERIVNRDSSEQIVPAVERSETSLRCAAKFLHDEVGLKTGRLLPYASQLVMLSFFYQNRSQGDVSVSDYMDGTLVKWFWLTSFNGWFAGANTTDLRRAADKMTDLSNRDIDEKHFIEFFSDRPLRGLPKAFDRRSARIRASLLLQIKARTPLDPRTGKSINGFEIFGNESTRDIPYFFLNAPGKLISSPANRIILPGNLGRSAKQVLVSMDNSVKDDVLRSHLITSEAFRLFLEDDAAGFIAKREAEIKRIETEFLNEIGLTEVSVPSSTEAVDESEVSDAFS